MTTFVDRGHFNHRGKAFECLHKDLAAHSPSPNGSLTWIRIRQNRQSVPYSAARKSITPCLMDHNSTPTKKKKLRSIFGCTSKPTQCVDPPTSVPASRLVQTVGPPAWSSRREGEVISNLAQSQNLLMGLNVPKTTWGKRAKLE
jgi:hypothetical protein